MGNKASVRTQIPRPPTNRIQFLLRLLESMALATAEYSAKSNSRETSSLNCVTNRYLPSAKLLAPVWLPAQQELGYRSPGRVCEARRQFPRDTEEI